MTASAADPMSTRTPVAYAPPWATTSALNRIVTMKVTMREDDDERPVRLGPLRRHAVARQIPRHEVQQADQRGRAGEPQDRDRAQVVDRPEGLAEMLVREVGEGAAVRFAAERHRLRRHQRGRDDAAADSITLMISAAAVSSFFVLRIRPCGFRSVSSASPRTSGMTATPVSNPDKPSASFGNSSSATMRHRDRSAVLRLGRGIPAFERRGLLPHELEFVNDHDRRSGRGRRRRSAPRAPRPRESL